MLMAAFSDLTMQVMLPGGVSFPLAYRAWGKADAKRSIMMVHGLTRNGRDFDRLAAHMAEQGAFVLCPDMPGRGKSGWLDDAALYSYETYILALHALMVQHPAAEWEWVGTSMGGILGMMMAAAPYGLIGSLVLNDIGEKVPANGMRRIAAYASKPPQFASMEEGEAYLRATFASFGLQSDEEWREFSAISLQPLASGGFALAYDPLLTKPLADYLDADKDMQDIDLSMFWSEVRCPVLLLRGEHSDILPQPVAAAMGARHNCKFITIPDCGHAPALMDSAQIQLVSEWLNARH
jgi:pimeloyl-ACP methyl ester carboxylesterase